ncbi:MAG TPA: 16S rRNA (uracil(1498)-N(3))-methyltransferase [Steroidobacteraceae bacterium]
MRLTRVYVDAPLASGKHCLVTGSAANHMVRVLRLAVGAAITLFDGAGGEYAARIESLRKDAVRVEVGAHAALERESPLDVTLAQGVSRGERMDWVVQKATELGVRRIVPLITVRSVVRLDAQQAPKKLQHWRGIAVAACEQCGRNRLPELAAPLDFLEFLGGEVAADAMRLVLSPAGSLRIGAIKSPQKIILLIGPEGGLAPEEAEAAIDRGFTAVSLGPRILRTETAAIAALAALQQAFGDL